jgi:hypothetical protein
MEPPAIGGVPAAVDSHGLGRLERVSHPRVVWSSESGDFTPWLAANLDVLALVLDLPLILEATEVPVGDFRLDIQARGPDGRVVIVENQLERTDHGHLGQLLAYAAGLEAATVVWVAPEFREDHRRTLDFLNEKTAEGLDFFGVEVGIVRIGEQGPPAPVFEVVSRPNDWSKAVKAISTGVAATGLSSTYGAMQQFFSDVLDGALQVRPSLRKPKPQNQNWVAFAGGPFGNFNLVFGGDRRLRVEAYLDNVDKALVKELFDEFNAKADEWEAKVGVPLEWDRLDGRRASRIAAYRAAFDLDDEVARLAALQWAATTTTAFLKTLEPALRSRAQQLKALSAQSPIT